jgi:gliding motility-associated-like protein
MLSIYSLQKKIWLSGILLTLLPTVVFSQQPVIKQVDKLVASTGQVVTIKGSGFGSIAANLKVYFGAAQAIINSVNDQLIEVEVPAGATFEKISVINTSSGLIGYQDKSFLLSFDGTRGITSSSFSAQNDFQARNGLYDLCLCDITLDGKKTDIATASGDFNSISLFENLSTISSLSFPSKTINLSAQTLHITCGDLDGDGKPDLVLSENSPDPNNSTLFILKNNGALPPTLQTIAVVGAKVKRVEIADVDIDGKPEIVASDQNGNNILVFGNQSIIGTLSFLPPVSILIAGTASTDGLAIEDLNGDGRPEILTSQFLTSNSNVYILKNQSTPGNINFTLQPPLVVTGTVVNLRMGDLDGDQKPDLVVTQLSGAGISIFLNQSSPTAIAFGPDNYIATDDRPWGLDFGDLDGDKKNDIVVASITKKSLTILNNNSTVGNIVFDKLIVSTTFINRHVKIGDLDGDGKPDIAFTSIDDKSLGVPSSKVSIIRNKNCMIPEITPVGPLTICTGFPLTLKATQGATTYTWKKDGIASAPTPTPSLNVTATGVYEVIATSEAGTCIKSSPPVNITVSSGVPIAVMTSTTNNGPVCIGSTLQVKVNDHGPGFTYKWTGPDGYTGSGPAPTIANFSLAKVGVYKVEVIDPGGCLARSATTSVSAIDAPSFTVGFTGSDIICSGDTKTLTIFPAIAGYTYQWFDQSGSLPGETASTISVSNSGNYLAKISSIASPTCLIDPTNIVPIKKVSIPAAAFSAPTQACTGQLITLLDQSIFDNQSTLTYLWDLGDSRTSSNPAPPPYSYLSAGPRTIKLTVSYPGGLCPNFTSNSISIISAPPVSIATVDNIFDVCPDKELTLNVSGGPFSSYQWSTNETSPSINTKGGITVSVIVKNSIGCELKATKTINLFSATTVVATAIPSEIGFDETSQLNVTGLKNSIWSPAESLSNPAISNPVAKPTSSTLYTVTGTDGNNCVGTGTVEVRIKNENVVDLLTPSNFISPNGDVESPTWVVENILRFSCGASIYDDKGVKVFESKKYDNSWDGTFNGRPLPDGVYYYIIRCDGQEGKPRTGSITLLR